MIITLDYPLTEDDIKFLASLGVDPNTPVIERAGDE